MLLQNRLPSNKIIAKDIIRQNTEIICHCQRAMRQQGGHSQSRIGRQHRKLCFQLCGAFRIVHHPFEQFLPDLIAHSIRDDHNCTLFCIAHISVIEIPLQRDLLKCPGFHNPLVPFRHDPAQELIGINVLNQRPKAFKCFGILELVEAVVELPVFLINLIISFLILSDDLFEAIRTAVICCSNQMICA